MGTLAQVGISGHLNIKSNTILTARSGVTKDVTNSILAELDILI